MMYFSFAEADSMFPANCSVTPNSLTAEEAKKRNTSNSDLEVACNPSHVQTINAMQSRYTIEMPVRSKPRLNATRHEYTPNKISTVPFFFMIWIVEENEYLGRPKPKCDRANHHRNHSR